MGKALPGSGCRPDSPVLRSQVRVPPVRPTTCRPSGMAETIPPARYSHAGYSSSGSANDPPQSASWVPLSPKSASVHREQNCVRALRLRVALHDGGCFIPAHSVPTCLAEGRPHSRFVDRPTEPTEAVYEHKYTRASLRQRSSSSVRSQKQPPSSRSTASCLTSSRLEWIAGCVPYSRDLLSRLR